MSGANFGRPGTRADCRPRPGIRLSAFHGNFFVRSTDLLALPAVPVDQSYAIELQMCVAASLPIVTLCSSDASEDPLTAAVAVFQTAVLHTTSSGERRIRVITLALPTTTSLAEVYGSADQVAIATLLANKAVERSMQAKLEDARDAVTNKLVDILGCASCSCLALWASYRIVRLCSLQDDNDVCWGRAEHAAHGVGEHALLAHPSAGLAQARTSEDPIKLRPGADRLT